MASLTDHPDMTLDVYRGRKTTMQQQQQVSFTFARQRHGISNSFASFIQGLSY